MAYPNQLPDEDSAPPPDEGSDDVDDAPADTPVHTPADARPTDFAALLALPGVAEDLVLDSRVGFMAFHGGNLERMTDEIATVAAARTGASLYAVRQPPGMRHHLPSTHVTPSASAKLAEFLDHVDIAIAIHGYGRDGLWQTLLLGGSNRDLARHFGVALRTALPDFTVLDDLTAIPPELAGQHPRNPVNRPRHGGVQIELPPRVRGLTPHAMTMPRKDGRIAWTNALIDGLVAATRAWPDR